MPDPTTPAPAPAALDRERHRLRVEAAPATVLRDLLSITDRAPAEAPPDRYRYVIERKVNQRDPRSRWRTVESKEYDSEPEARDAGQARWRELIGPLYVEAEPLGPTDGGDSAGSAQIGTSWVRRFERALTDGQHFAVIDVEYHVVNVNMDSDGPVQPVLSRVMAYTLYTDLADRDNNEVWVDTRSRDYDQPTGRVPTDQDALRLCTEFDGDQLDWDGQRDLPY